jgi:demethylmenaquinone methyltransferase/2-methoxy-6-polyprenyl-1,4-benzoquinol methylase
VTDLSKAPPRIAGMFDAIAGRYDVLNHVLSGNLDRRWRRRAVRALALRGGDRVLDLCTGTADLAIAAHEGAPAPVRIVGVDFAGAMLGVGQTKLRRRHLAGPITLVRGDATAIPVAAGAVNALTIGFGIRNVEDTAAACAEMFRVLAPGGRLAILEFANPSAPGFRTLYRWYSTHVLPRIGRLVSRHQAAYEYLPASIEAFATPAELVNFLRQAGFVDLAAIPLTFGAVYLYTARKS